MNTHTHTHTHTRKGLHTCEADGTLEGAAHALEAVLDQVTLQLGGGVE